MNALMVRVVANWRTTAAGTASFIVGTASIVAAIYYPANNSPKALLLVSALAAFITNLLAKDK
jgi:hypothetical protein